MFGRRGTPQGSSTKVSDAASPFLRTFSEQSERYIERAKECQSRREYVQASAWAAQARRCLENIDRIRCALE